MPAADSLEMNETDWRPWANSQRHILRGIGADHVRYVFFRMRAGRQAQARALVHWLAQEVSGADTGRSASASIQAGFTFEGLEALCTENSRVDAAWLADFARRAPAFAQGAERRAPVWLGDVGTSAPEHWEAAYRATPHMVVSLHGSEAQVEASGVELSTQAGIDSTDGAWERLGFEEASAARDGHSTGVPIPLGLRDGITQLRIRGLRPNLNRPKPQGEEHAMGEFLLGYPNEDGANVWALPERKGETGWGMYLDGSFGVLRKMQLHGAAWRRYLEAVCVAYGKSGQNALDEVAGRLLGRAPNGPPLIGPGSAEEAPTGTWDSFDFSSDPGGLACPYGSHIRRMNPRGDGALVESRRRPLIRRGLPYRQPAPPHEGSADPVEGLLGLFFCADLKEQFEHLLGQWARRDALGSRNAGCAQDPFAPGDPDGRSFDFPGWTLVEGQSAPPLPSLTTTRGTLYLFYPGLSAIAALAGVASEPAPTLMPTLS